jgi:hypothetical protein
MERSNRYDPAEAEVDNLSEVWCYRCDKAGVASVMVSSGGAKPERRTVCTEHLWLLRQAANIR